MNSNFLFQLLKSIKVVLTIVFMLASVSSNAQCELYEWQKVYGGSGDDVPYDIEENDFGGYIVAGHTNSKNLNPPAIGIDAWVLRLSSTGDIVSGWPKVYGGTGTQKAYAVEVVRDPATKKQVGYIIAGEGKEPGSSDYDMFVKGITLTGEEVFTKYIGGSLNDGAYDVKQTDDGFIIVGYTFSPVPGKGPQGKNYYVVTISFDGDQILKNEIYASDKGVTEPEEEENDFAMSVERYVDQAGNTRHVVAGYCRSCNPNVGNGGPVENLWMHRLDKHGVSFDNDIHGPDAPPFQDKGQGSSEIHRSGNGFISVGITHTQAQNFCEGITEHNIWVIKTDDEGNLVWTNCYGGNDSDEGFSIFEKNPGGGYIVAGGSKSDMIDGLPDPACTHGNRDFFLFEINNDGAIQWAQHLGGRSGDTAMVVKKTADGGFIVAGSSGSNDYDVIDTDPAHGGVDFWILKYSATAAGKICSAPCNLIVDPGLTTATVSWNAVGSPTTCALGYQIQYRKKGCVGCNWKTKNSTHSSTVIDQLIPNTEYEWKVATICSTIPTIKLTGYSEILTFKTELKLSGETDWSQSNELQIYPNPTASNFNIELQLSNDLDCTAHLELIDMMGQSVYQKETSLQGGMLVEKISLDEKMVRGIYFARVIAGEKVYTHPVMLE